MNLTSLFIVSNFPPWASRSFLLAGQPISTLFKDQKRSLEVRALALAGPGLVPVLLVETNPYFSLELPTVVLQIALEKSEIEVRAKVLDQPTFCDYRQLINLPLSDHSRTALKHFIPGKCPLPEEMQWLAPETQDLSMQRCRSFMTNYDQHLTHKFYQCVEMNQWKAVKEMRKELHLINPNHLSAHNNLPWSSLDHAVYHKNFKMVQFLCSIGAVTVAMTESFRELCFPTLVQQFSSDLSLQFWVKASRNKSRSLQKLWEAHSSLIFLNVAIGDLTPLDFGIYYNNQEMVNLLWSIGCRSHKYTLEDLIVCTSKIGSDTERRPNLNIIRQLENGGSPANWSPEHTHEWIKTVIPEEEAMKLFINGEDLVRLSFQDIRDCGVLIGAARKLENAIQQLLVA